MRRILLVVVVWGAFISSAQAAIISVSPTSYEMRNGSGTANGGTFNYWDLFYGGSPINNVDNAPLTGGLGDLTNGVIASGNWFQVEVIQGTGPYVGWRDSITPNPVINFNFASSFDFRTVRIHLDDANGNGGVMLPSAANINGTLFSIIDPPGSAPLFIDFDVTNLASANQLSVQLIHRDQWVFASEFSFTAESNDAVPEPTSALLLVGLGAMLPLMKRRQRAS